MTNGELARELSQYPLTAIATGLLNFERFNYHLTKLTTEENMITSPVTSADKSNPLTLPEEERRKLFGERVKMMRKLHGFTRDEVAEKLGVTVALIYAYESGKREPSIKSLIALSQTLEVETDWLLGLTTKLKE